MIQVVGKVRGMTVIRDQETEELRCQDSWVIPMDLGTFQDDGRTWGEEDAREP